MPFLKRVKMPLSNYSLSTGQMVLIKYASYSALTKVLRGFTDDGLCKFMG